MEQVSVNGSLLQMVNCAPTLSVEFAGSQLTVLIYNSLGNVTQRNRDLGEDSTWLHFQASLTNTQLQTVMATEQCYFAMSFSGGSMISAKETVKMFKVPPVILIASLSIQTSSTSQKLPCLMRELFCPVTS